MKKSFVRRRRRSANWLIDGPDSLVCSKKMRGDIRMRGSRNTENQDTDQFTIILFILRYCMEMVYETRMA